MPYKDKNRGRERIAEKRMNPEYKLQEKMQRIEKCSTPEERLRRANYKKSEKGKAAEERYRKSAKGQLTFLKNHLKRRYGLTLAQLDVLVEQQNNRCKLCGDMFTQERFYVVDHNHDTGAVRGLIHQKCNMLIGLANDNQFLLKAALEYLDNNN